ncbi:MAG TPA: MAE_28990/MAE_18760 family HEPN-like nuclease, partial [Longimicrobiaceae bacterium]|nr:MAE_28990/MAE_18760 family HEPN-like nuclease [Longimicrobiaceae bacterium]
HPACAPYQPCLLCYASRGAAAACPLHGQSCRRLGAASEGPLLQQPSKRQFDYNSVVVSLYGFLEQYIESLLREYIARLNAIAPRYGDLPEQVRKHHTDLTVALLSRVEQSRYRGVVTPATLVANLHTCLSELPSFLLNTEAFALHTANFRSDVIEDSFARVGVLSVNQRIRHFSPFSEYIVHHFPGRDSSGLSNSELFFFLDDLAERRNEVAHGSAGELLSNELLLDYLVFVEVYGLSLYELAVCDSLGHEVRHHGNAVGRPVAVYNNEIVCVELRDASVKVGDLLVAETGYGIRPYIGGEILEMQVDGTPISHIRPGVGVPIAMRVAFRAKQNHSFFVLHRP